MGPLTILNRLSLHRAAEEPERIELQTEEADTLNTMRLNFHVAPAEMDKTNKIIYFHTPFAPTLYPPA